MAFAASPFLGFFFAFAAMVLLIFVSVSAPTWSRIYFLSAQGVRYGVFGSCAPNGCTGTSIGYTLPFENNAIRRLTSALILVPISAGIAGIAAIFGLLGMFAASRFSTILMALASGISFLSSLFIMIYSASAFGIIRSRVRDNGGQADYGMGLWFLVAATGSLLLAFLASCLGSCGRFRRDKY